jgi:sec-independent protein translocase protein TatA
MGGMSLMHWLIVIMILLIFFGPSRLPELGKGIGQAIRGFKKGLSEIEDEVEKPTPAPSEKLQASTPHQSHQTTKEKVTEEKS